MTFGRRVLAFVVLLVTCVAATGGSFASARPPLVAASPEPSTPSSAEPSAGSTAEPPGPASAEPSGPASTEPSTEPSSSAGPSESVPPGEQTSYLAAAEAELALRAGMLEDVNAAAVIGPAGPAVLADIQQNETAFGQEAISNLLSTYKIDLAAATGRDRLIAAIGDFPQPGQSTADTWTGSILGATSFMVSTWMSFAPLLLENLATKSSFQTGTQQHATNYDKVVDGVREQLTLNEKVTVGAGQGRVVFDVVITSSSVMSDPTSGSPIARRTSTGTGHFEINGCPDAQGVSPGTYTLVNQEEVSRAGGTANGGASTTNATFRVLDGDDAHLVQTEAQVATAAGAHGTGVGDGGGSGEPFDWGAQATFGITIPRSGSASIGPVSNETSHDVPADRTSTLASILSLAENYLAEAAKATETYWRSGDCIVVNTTEESRDVAASEAVQVQATAKGAFDGQPIDKPIQGTFTGVQSLDPASGTKVDPPAAFTVTAGVKDGDKATLALEQISKRGIGTKSLDFTVKSQDLVLNVKGTESGSHGGAHYQIRFVISDLLLKHDAAGGWSGSGEIAAKGKELLGECSVAIDLSVPITVQAQTDASSPDLVRLLIPQTHSGTVYEKCPVIGSVPVPAQAVFGPLVGGISARSPYPIDSAKAVSFALSKATVTVKRKKS